MAALNLEGKMALCRYQARKVLSVLNLMAFGKSPRLQRNISEKVVPGERLTLPCATWAQEVDCICRPLWCMV